MPNQDTAYLFVVSHVHLNVILYESCMDTFRHPICPIVHRFALKTALKICQTTASTVHSVSFLYLLGQKQVNVHRSQTALADAGLSLG